MLTTNILKSAEDFHTRLTPKMCWVEVEGNCIVEMWAGIVNVALALAVSPLFLAWVAFSVFYAGAVLFICLLLLPIDCITCGMLGNDDTTVSIQYERMRV